MKRVSGGSRRMGGSGTRGISRSSMGSRSSSSLRSSNHLNRHHSHLYRRHYGNSILPKELRIIMYVVIIIIAIFILFL